MGDVTGAAAEAVNKPEGDIIAILLQQHIRIRELFAQVKADQGEQKQRTFDELRALLAVHETAEEMVLRPVSREDAGEQVADALNQEEADATRLLAAVEKMDVSGAEFDAQFDVLERVVLDHAAHEEQEEFPAVRARESDEKLVRMGEALKAAENLAPTHPHPSTAGSPAAQWAAGPFASMVDRARDAVKKAMPG